MILEATQKYRKRLCRLMILTQNLADLIILYGREVTRGLIGNFDYKVLLGGIGDLETFSKLIGYSPSRRTLIFFHKCHIDTARLWWHAPQS